MDEEDHVMEEDVVQSTEVNGNHLEKTIDPTMIALHDSVQAPYPKRKEQLPILSHGEPAASVHVSSGNVGPSILDSGAQVLLDQSEQSSVDMGSDEMDITPPASSNIEVRIRVPPPPKFPHLPYSSSKTGLVYDSRMRFHAEPISQMMDVNEIHPEDPRRIHEIFQEIQQAGLVQSNDDSEESAKDEQCWRINARMATRGEICLIHTSEHYDFVESLQGTHHESRLPDIH